jgi:ATP adenylyltransferase/5',5'''-P-1,P-4-tetraphosphate phosphorylase II
MTDLPKIRREQLLQLPAHSSGRTIGAAMFFLKKNFQKNLLKISDRLRARHVLCSRDPAAVFASGRSFRAAARHRRHVWLVVVPPAEYADFKLLVETTCMQL